MQKKALFFIALFSGFGTLLYGQKTQANPPFLSSAQVSAAMFSAMGPASDEAPAEIEASDGSVGYVLPDALVFSTTTVPDGLYGSAYTPQPLTVTGGTAPYTFSVSGGSLPQGMALSAGGILSGTPTAAGTYSFTVTAQDATPSPDQVSGSQSYTMVIGKAALTITAVNANKLYGAALPALTVTYSGFVNGDNAASLTTAPAVTTTATAASSIGTFPISVSGAVDPNYNFTYNGAMLTVSPAPLTITADDKSMTYGGAVPALTVSYTGFVNGDNASSLTLQPTIVCLATSLSPAGTYPITALLAVDLNYTITYQPGTMTINKAVLTVTADNKTMPLGGPVPALTFTITGFVNLDIALLSLSAQPTVSTTATAASPAAATRSLPQEAPLPTIPSIMSTVP